MNWVFKSIPRPGSLTDLIEDYKGLLVSGLEEFIESTPLTEKQGESWFTEYPDGGYCWTGPSYRFTFSAGWYDKKYGYVKMGRIPYNVSVERADGAVYASEVDLEFPIEKRIRLIDNVSPIE